MAGTLGYDRVSWVELCSVAVCYGKVRQVFLGLCRVVWVEFWFVAFRQVM